MARRSGTHYDGDLARDLVDAAVGVIARSGPDAVSLRALARDLGVSHGAPAKHFRDLEGLFTAIATEAFELLDGRMRAAAADHDDPLDGLRAGGVAYVRFAIDNPGHFTLMWTRHAYDDDHPPLAEASGRSYTFLAELVVDARARGWRASVDPGDLVAAVWAGVHGLATLWGTAVFEAAFHQDVDESVPRLVRLLLDDR